MTEQEILIRAREALIANFKSPDEQTLKDVRAGEWDGSPAIHACIAFANSLSLPLSSIQPPTPQLAAARAWAAGRLQSNGLAGEAAEVQAGKMDWQPLVVAFLAGAGA